MGVTGAVTVPDDGVPPVGGGPHSAGDTGPNSNTEAVRYADAR